MEAKFNGISLFTRINLTQIRSTNLLLSSNQFKYFVAGALASKYTEAIPATSLLLREADKVLINNVHDYSDWVVTFDRNLGPEVYDLPGKDGEIPFFA